jgi:hypothetical protein
MGVAHRREPPELVLAAVPAVGQPARQMAILANPA